MEDSIQEKIDRFREMAKKSADHKRNLQTPAKPDSLSTVIRTKEDAAVFMAQLDALTELARKEYQDNKKQEAEANSANISKL